MFQLIQDDGGKEIKLKKGSKIKLTTDQTFRENCNEEILWIDLQTISKVIQIGRRIFIDDGRISVVATEIGLKL